MRYFGFLSPEHPPLLDHTTIEHPEDGHYIFGVALVPADDVQNILNNSVLSVHNNHSATNGGVLSNLTDHEYKIDWNSSVKSVLEEKHEPASIDHITQVSNPINESTPLIKEQSTTPSDPAAIKVPVQGEVHAQPSDFKNHFIKGFHDPGENVTSWFHPAVDDKSTINSISESPSSPPPPTSTSETNV